MSQPQPDPSMLGEQGSARDATVSKPSTARRSPRQRRHARTRQAILDAARRIVAQEGAEALSMREIARRIDYSPAGLYEYFDGKEDIIGAICVEGSQRLADHLSSVPEALPPAERVAALGRAYLDFARDNAEHYRLMFNAPQTPTREEAPPYGGPYDILRHAVRDGIEAGAFPARPGFGTEEMAFAAWSLVHGIASLRATRAGAAAEAMDAAAGPALAAFVRGLGAGEEDVSPKE